MVVSRTAELRRMDRLLARLLEGHGGALVVHGEAGIGKTTLLDALVERADERVTVLRASGVETEAQLRAAGARRRRTRSALTPQELRVAAAVRAGASNREIAAQLFLSPRTIEFHLRQIYRKLGIRSRTQLAATPARDDAAPERD